MIELLKGRISDTEGLKEVLELVAETYSSVSSAVLDIETDTISGRIGIAWGKFITGALVNAPEQKGKKALRQLLCLREGKFVFNDLELDPPITELRQALGVDLLRTISVVPHLDPKEADFLWDAGEAPAEAAAAQSTQEETPKTKSYIAAAEPVVDEPEWVEPEEVETHQPEVRAATDFETHDNEPVLPNFEQMFTAVSQNTNWDDNLPVPDISEADLAQAYEIRRLPPKPGFEATPALDAIFGSKMPDGVTKFEESGLPKTFNPQPVAGFESQPATPDPELSKSLVDPIPRLRVSQGRFNAIEIVDEDGTSVEPLIPAPVVGKPLLQPNTVATPEFIGQRFVDPATNMRPAPAPDSGKLAQLIICIILFVVSCASTILLGPRAWDFITSVLHH